MFTRRSDFTDAQRKRFIATWGPWDADHRMQIISYQYLAAQEVFERCCVDQANRVFRFEESVGKEILYYLHPDEPWLVFTLRDGSVWAYENTRSLKPFSEAFPVPSIAFMDVPFDEPDRWHRACLVDQLPIGLWVQLGVTEGMDYPARICRMDDGAAYGQWI